MKTIHTLIGAAAGIGFLLSAPASASCPSGYFVEVDGVIPSPTASITASGDPLTVSFLGLFGGECAVELEATIDECGFGEITAFEIERGVDDDPLCDDAEALNLPWDMEVTSVNAGSETAQVLVTGASIQASIATCSGSISPTLNYGASPAFIDFDNLWMGLCQTHGQLEFNEELDAVAK